MRLKTDQDGNPGAVCVCFFVYFCVCVCMFLGVCVSQCLCDSHSSPVALVVWVLSLITSVRKISHLSQCTCCSGQRALVVEPTASTHQKTPTTYLFLLAFSPPTPAHSIRDATTSSLGLFTSSNLRSLFGAPRCTPSTRLQGLFNGGLLLVKRYLTLHPIKSCVLISSNDSEATGLV